MAKCYIEIGDRDGRFNMGIWSTNKNLTGQQLTPARGKANSPKSGHYTVAIPRPRQMILSMNVRDKDVQVFAEENTYVQEKLSESNCRLGNIFVVDMTVTRRHLAT
ncbi:hypothetical protein BDV29DRAFT_152858 [Aspergillus leporis]|uniref:Uncharacterized protein n=1 Tax=Aspergillus leporis TaxID=41062 RepID=A0A5N5XC85_9EURO|nr:hypothetical protein BDV29DRAFT_152858 [Aspergillus leporis]